MLSQERRRDLLCVALLAGAATILLVDVLLAGANFYYRDLYVYHLPMKRIVREAILSGEFPFWNPYLSAGQPLAANPAYELFYPPQLLILAGSYLFGFALHIVFHIYAALIGMFVLLRQMALTRPAAVFGALSFGLSGFLLGMVPLLPTFFVWSTAPWVAWGVIRFLQEPSARRFGAAALLAAMPLLVGEPMSLGQMWILILVGVLLAGRRLPNWRGAAWTIAIGAGAAMVAAVQLVPAIDHVADSSRARGLPWTMVRQFALTPLRPAEIVIPHAFGVPNPFAMASWGGHLFADGSPYLGSLYAGIFVPIFALAGFLMRLPGARTAAFLALLSYALALGDRTPLLHILYSTGLLRGVRYPEKFAALGVVTLVVFAAFACDRLLTRNPRAWRATAVAAAVVVAIAALPVAWSLQGDFAASFVRIFDVSPGQTTLPAQARSLWIIGLLATAAAAALIIAARRGIGRPLLLLSFLLLAADILWYGNIVLTRLPAEFFDPPAITEEMKGNRSQFSVFHRGEWMADHPNRRRFFGTSVIWTSRNALPPLTAPLWGFRSVLELDFDETALLPTHDLLDTMMALGNSGHPQWAEPFATMSNVRYMLDYRDFDEDRLQSQGDPFRSKPVRATRLNEQPRYFFAESLQRVRTRDEALTFFRQTPRPYGTALVSFQSAAPARGRVARVREGWNGADIDVIANGPAFLVATVTRHKYWRATVDGRPVPLVPANIAYQGLAVPAGAHRVELRYRNPVVVWSAVVSILAAGVAVAMILRPPRRRLRTGS